MTEVDQPVKIEHDQETVSEPINRVVSKKTKRGVIFAVFLAVLALSAVVIYFGRNKISEILIKAGILSVLRDKGLVRVTTADYFEAVSSGNLLYDYNSDGAVSEEDYSLMMTDLYGEAVTEETLALTTDEVPAESGNLILPSVRGTSADIFTGSATTSHPIELPPAPDSMVPLISLSYSSGAVDDLYTGTETKWRNDLTHPYQAQAGIVGLGWSLSSGGSVMRDTQGTLNDPADDTFVLSFAGGYANLVKESDDGYTSVWRTAPNLKAKVVRYALCKTDTKGDTNTDNDINICRYYWSATTTDGTKYLFGNPSASGWKVPEDPDYANTYLTGDWYPLYKDNSAGRVYTPWMIYGSSIKGWHALVTQWPLSRVESVFYTAERNTDIEYYYQAEYLDYNGKQYTSATYPHKILYGRNEVDFVREDRLDWQIHQGDNTIIKQPMYAKQRIRKILVKTLDTTIRSYVLNYVYGWEPGKHLDANGNGVPDSLSEVKSGQVIHSILTGITPWSGDPG